MKLKNNILIFGLLLSSLVLGGCGHPSDASIVSRFNKKKSSYEEISNMAKNDKHLWRIAKTWYRTAAGENVYEPRNELLSEEKWRQYRDLFFALGLSDGISIEEGNVYFLISSIGIVGSGSSKGIAFIGSKDGAKSTNSNAPHGITYTPIEGNWFIFEDR